MERYGREKNNREDIDGDKNERIHIREIKPKKYPKIDAKHNEEPYGNFPVLHIQTILHNYPLCKICFAEFWNFFDLGGMIEI
jgi:hypothetical protein